MNKRLSSLLFDISLEELWEQCPQLLKATNHVLRGRNPRDRERRFDEVNSSPATFRGVFAIQVRVICRLSA
jgi:hypothetical protein